MVGGACGCYNSGVVCIQCVEGSWGTLFLFFRCRVDNKVQRHEQWWRLLSQLLCLLAVVAVAVFCREDADAATPPRARTPTSLWECTGRPNNWVVGVVALRVESHTFT